MMKKILLIAALFCSNSFAQQNSILFTGQDLYTRLSTNTIWAYGYISGVADAQSGVTICIPANTVTVGQMGDMVKQTLERLPSERHLSADIFVQVALESRWPCKKKGGGV